MKLPGGCLFLHRWRELAARAFAIRAAPWTAGILAGKNVELIRKFKNEIREAARRFRTAWRLV